MGTRGIFGFRINGEDKLSYNHFDSYPDGLGKSILDQLRVLLPQFGIEGMRRLADKIEPLPKMRKDLSALQKRTLKKYEHKNTGDPGETYGLVRDMQGQLPAMLQTGMYLQNEDFILDSLFCEWGYIVNLDDETLEVYRGFQKNPMLVEGRYAKLYKPDKKNMTMFGHDYAPCSLILTVPLNELPDEFNEKKLRGNEDDDEEE